MKWHILTIDDERSSDICQTLRQRDRENGGLTFPITVGMYTWTEDAVVPYIGDTAGSYYTNLFHEHCRSHLVPVYEGMVHEDMDEIDELMLVDGALSYSATLDAFEEERSIMQVLAARVRRVGDIVQNFLFRRRKRE